MIKKFRKKPVVIEAVQYDGENLAEIAEFCDETLRWDSVTEILTIETLEGPHIASPGDWIIKGVAGEFYPCKPDIFAETYDKVGNGDNFDGVGIA